MTMSVPVLEKTLDIQPGAHAELMETLLKLFYANLLILTIFQPAIAVSKVELFGGHTGVSVLEAFNLEN